MRPPRVAEWLLRRLCRGEAGVDIAGDLAEEFALSVDEHGARRARRWYRWQVVRSIVVRASGPRESRAHDPHSAAATKDVAFVRAWADVRHGWRALSARRGSSVATVAVFALGVGLVSAMFALADPYVLRPLPYDEPDELVTISVGGRQDAFTGFSAGLVPTLDEWRAQTSLFQDVAMYGGGQDVLVRTDEGAVLLQATLATDNLLEVLAVGGPTSPAWRATSAATDIPVLLTPEGQAVLPGDLGRPGAPLTSAAVSYRIAGALPLNTALQPIRGHLLVPLASGPIVDIWESADGSSRSIARRTVIARLQPGVTPAAVREALTSRLADPTLAVDVERLGDSITSNVRPLATGALGAGLLILLVCAGNVANLFLARSTYRVREFATRAALGASWLDIGRLWLVELVLIATAAVLGGLAIAGAALFLAGRVVPEQYVTLGDPAVTARVVGFSALAGLAVVLVGAVPAGFAIHLSPEAVFGRRRQRRDRIRFVRQSFAGVQSAIAVILVVGAGMLLQSYVNLVAQDTGFEGTSLTVGVAYPGDPRASIDVEVVDRTLAAVRRIPGVEAASMASNVVADGFRNRAVFVEGENAFPSSTEVRPGFFDAAGITLVEGRPLQAIDESWRGVVVNEAFVRLHWPDGGAVGRLLERSITNRLPKPSGRESALVVGVVRDVHAQGLEHKPEPTVYSLGTAFHRSRYVARVTGDPLDYGGRIRRAIADVSPDAVIEPAETIQTRLGDTIRQKTFATLVLTFFGLAGGAVTLAGLVGMVTFVVARRTREIAIRMAIGAERSHIRRLVVREAITSAVAGGLAGLLVGRWLSTWLESFVFGIEAGNWTTAIVGAAAAMLLMVVAALLPAQRAVNLEPTAALRVE